MTSDLIERSIKDLTKLSILKDPRVESKEDQSGIRARKSTRKWIESTQRWIEVDRLDRDPPLESGPHRISRCSYIYTFKKIIYKSQQINFQSSSF